MDYLCREETSGDLPMIYILTSATFSRSSYFRSAHPGCPPPQAPCPAVEATGHEGAVGHSISPERGHGLRPRHPRQRPASASGSTRAYNDGRRLSADDRTARVDDGRQRRNGADQISAPKDQSIRKLDHHGSLEHGSHVQTARRPVRL